MCMCVFGYPCALCDSLYISVCVVVCMCVCAAALDGTSRSVSPCGLVESRVGLDRFFVRIGALYFQNKGDFGCE